MIHHTHALSGRRMALLPALNKQRIASLPPLPKRRMDSLSPLTIRRIDSLPPFTIRRIDSLPSLYKRCIKIHCLHWLKCAWIHYFHCLQGAWIYHPQMRMDTLPPLTSTRIASIGYKADELVSIGQRAHGCITPIGHKAYGLTPLIPAVRLVDLCFLWIHCSLSLLATTLMDSLPPLARTNAHGFIGCKVHGLIAAIYMTTRVINITDNS